MGNMRPPSMALLLTFLSTCLVISGIPPPSLVYKASPLESVTSFLRGAAADVDEIASPQEAAEIRQALAAGSAAGFGSVTRAVLITLEVRAC